METRKTRKRKLSPIKEGPKPKVQKRPTELCKACNQERVLLMHLSRSPECRDHYPDFEEMKKQKNANRMKTYKLNNKEKISTSNKTYYQNLIPNHINLHLSLSNQQ